MPVTVDTTQMNVRIGSSLKREGDAVLAEAGYTPSQAVRAVWELAVRLRNQPGRLREILEDAASDTPHEDAQDVPDASPALIAYRKGQSEVLAMIERMHLSTEPHPNQPTDEELREMRARELLYGDDAL